MLGWFPSPYPDELLYSICARYDEVMQYSYKQSLNVDLLGDRYATAVIDLPVHLEHLVSVLPPNQIYSVESLIGRHTLFPFYAPFILPNRMEHVRKIMRSGSRASVHAVSGINTCPIRRPNRLRFCPICAEQDRERFGETYWHRVHQLPGVEVCPDHLTFLENSSLSVLYRRYEALYVPAEQTIGVRPADVRRMDREDKSHQVLVRLASDAAWLLDQNLTHDNESLRVGYRTLLIGRGLMSQGGLMRTQKLMQAFSELYPHTLLAALRCDIDAKSSNIWVTLLLSDLKRGKIHHPLRHLLMIQFLGSTAESFFAHCRKQQTVAPVIQAEPFGTGPYLCLNPACRFFQQPVIDEVIIKQNKRTYGLPVGFFTCTCGFSYARRGPDRSPADQFRYDRVKTYGAVWTASLKEMWADQKISIRAIARRLGCNFQNIIDKAIRMGLPYPRDARRKKLAILGYDDGKKPVKGRLLSSPTEQQDEKQRLTMLYREQLLSAIREQPEATRTMVSKSVRIAYRWLWGNDREWLEQQLPPPRKLSWSICEVDWASRDARLAQEVRQAAAALKDSSEKPVRVVKREIARYLGEYRQLNSRKCLARLPLTVAALNEAVETRTAFALRRIRWVGKRLHEEKCALTFTEVAQRASINHKMRQAPEIKAAIEAVLISSQPTNHPRRR
jgi:Tn7-like transposition protein D/TniQ